MAPKRYAYDYYDVELPSDLTDGMEGEDVLDLAIIQAREMARDYKIPCIWFLSSISYDAFEPVYRICRKSIRGRA